MVKKGSGCSSGWRKLLRKVKLRMRYKLSKRATLPITSDATSNNASPLPLELVHLILRQLSTSDICSSAIASRFMQTAAEYLLYSNISFDRPSPEPIMEFFRAITASPRRGEYVRTLRLPSLPDFEGYVRVSRTKVRKETYLDLLESSMAALVNLKILDLYFAPIFWVTFEYDAAYHSGCASALCRCPSGLDVFTYEGPVLPITEFLTNQSELIALKLRFILGQDDASQGALDDVQHEAAESQMVLPKVRRAEVVRGFWLSRISSKHLESIVIITMRPSGVILEEHHGLVLREFRQSLRFLRVKTRDFTAAHSIVREFGGGGGAILDTLEVAWSVVYLGDFVSELCDIISDFSSIRTLVIDGPFLDGRFFLAAEEPTQGNASFDSTARQYFECLPSLQKVAVSSLDGWRVLSRNGSPEYTGSLPDGWAVSDRWADPSAVFH